MDEINELIKNDLKDRSWKNHYDKLDLSKQPHLPRIYFFGSVFGVILFMVMGKIEKILVFLLL